MPLPKHLGNQPGSSGKTQTLTSFGFQKGLTPQNKEKLVLKLNLLLFAEHNIAYSVADHLADLLKEVVTDSKLIKEIELKRTKLQSFAAVEPHKILKPSQTRWLSLLSVVERILEQWEALRLFFIDFTTNPAHRARADKPFPNTYATYGSGPRIIAPADYAKKQIIDNQWRTLPNARARHPQRLNEISEPDKFWAQLLKTEDFSELAHFALSTLSLPHAMLIASGASGRIASGAALTIGARDRLLRHSGSALISLACRDGDINHCARY
ncbi:hypothetical protein EVAR_87850_1 [Eumeta japonica]|uniref:Uncharacterized protein n=1 Tax=Eumeta variegata TaxID=151549 RepID=A0A4C1YI17_EUMVA|nr:hypothetical protein EVAR_87850_1 [Eumeta japonica]